jgi:S1-C subfamily serine protease
MRHGPLPLAALALFGALTQPLQSADLVDLARTARPAVVRLKVQDSIGRDLGTGTGFFTGKDGNIVTNFHVVEDADRVVADTSDGRRIPILGLLAKDEKNDIAILKTGFVPGPGSTLALANPEAPAVQPGDRIFVIGAPIGLSGTLSEGIVSALRPSQDMSEFSPGKATDRADLLQITAAISPGSSGSPVINTNGAVVGVAASYLGGGQNLNFAVPAAVVHKLLAGITADTIPTPFQNKKPLVNIIISVLFFAALFVGFRYMMRRL